MVGSRLGTLVEATPDPALRLRKLRAWGLERFCVTRKQLNQKGTVVHLQDW